jgi:CMP-N,N'-diacetyllegionaminic acid synthase
MNSKFYPQFNGPTYALIPARANSKRVKRKNFRMVGGKPLIYHTIKAAMQSRVVDHVYLSTEDQQLAVLAGDLANEIDSSGTKFSVLVRDRRYSQDNVQTDAVFYDMLLTIQASTGIENPSNLILLQPTSPLRDSADIDAAFAVWDHASTLVSCEELSGFFWSDEGTGITPINHDPRFRLGTQDGAHGKMYRENGAIYICKASVLAAYKTYRFPPYDKYVMPESKGVDIDYEDDLELANQLMELDNEHIR